MNKNLVVNLMRVGLICLVLAFSVIASCVSKVEESTDEKSVENNTSIEEAVDISNRIKTSTAVHGYFAYYEIVIVDGQEYLSSSSGGLIKLEPKN